MKQGSHRENLNHVPVANSHTPRFPENIRPGPRDLIASGMEETPEIIHTMTK